MRNAEWINLIYFSVFVVIALILPKVRWSKRGRAIAIGLSGIALIWATSKIEAKVIRDWAPAPLMLFAYWQAGSLFRSPNEKLQKILADFDRKLLGRFSFSNSILNSYLELTYLFCYPLVPLGLAFLYYRNLANHSDSYWTAILIPTYFCHAMVPFTQTYPPWMIEQQKIESHRNLIRVFNFWIIKYASIHANTLPSAHVTASMAAAIMLLQLLPVVGSIFLLTALSICVAAVAGRYHYMLDVIAAAILVIVVFAVLK
jgi:membrane-associated phospholipid phosphatase